jgi:membrane protein implicated in regulation of membrane protease activity
MSLLTFWIIVCVIAVAIDIATSNFFFICFTGGGVCAIIANSLNLTPSVQIIIFVAVSSLIIAFGYPLMRKTLKKTVPKTLRMEEKYVGREIQIEKDITDKDSIKIDGIYWTVKNAGEPIQKGDRVKITGIEGNKIIIKKL